MFCSKCGNKLPAGMRFCGMCGNDITQGSPADSITPENMTAQPHITAQQQKLAGYGVYPGAAVPKASSTIKFPIIAVAVMLVSLVVSVINGLGAVLSGYRVDFFYARFVFASLGSLPYYFSYFFLESWLTVPWLVLPVAVFAILAFTVSSKKIALMVIPLVLHAALAVLSVPVVFVAPSFVVVLIFVCLSAAGVLRNKIVPLVVLVVVAVVGVVLAGYLPVLVVQGRVSVVSMVYASSFVLSAVGYLVLVLGRKAGVGHAGD